MVGGRESDTFANWSTIVGGDNGFMFSGTDNQRDTIVGNEPFDDTCSF